MMKKLALVLALLLFAVLLCACMGTPATTTNTTTTTTAASTSSSQEKKLTVDLFTLDMEVGYSRAACVGFEESITLAQAIDKINSMCDYLPAECPMYWMDGYTVLLPDAVFYESKNIAFYEEGVGKEVTFVCNYADGTSDVSTLVCPAMYMESFILVISEAGSAMDIADFTYNGAAVMADTVVDGGTVVFTEKGKDPVDPPKPPVGEMAITVQIHTPMASLTATVPFEGEIAIPEIIGYIDANYDHALTQADAWFWMDGYTLIDTKNALFTESKTISYIGSGMGMNVEFIFIDEYGTASEGATYPCPAMYLSSFVRFLEEIHAFEETAGSYTYNGAAANANTVIDGGTVVFTENESVAPYTVSYVYNGTSGSFTLDYAISLTQLLQRLDPNIEYYNDYTHRVTIDGAHPWDVNLELDADCTVVVDCIYNVYVNVQGEHPEGYTLTIYGNSPTGADIVRELGIDKDLYIWEMRDGHVGAMPDGPLFERPGMHDISLRPRRVQIMATFIRPNGMMEQMDYSFEGSVPASEIFAQFFAYSEGSWTVAQGEGEAYAIDESYVFLCNANEETTVYTLRGVSSTVNVRVHLSYATGDKTLLFTNVQSGKTLGALLAERGYDFSDFTDWFGFALDGSGTGLGEITANTTFTASAEISAQYCGASATVVYNGTHYTCLLEEDMTLEDIINAVYLNPYDGAWKVTGPDGVFYPSLSTVLSKTASDGSPAIYTITQNDEAVRIFYYTGEYFYVNGDVMQFVGAGTEWAPQEAFASANPFVRFLYWAAEKDGAQVRINDADDLFALGASEVELIPVYEADMSALKGAIHYVEMGNKLYIDEAGVVYYISIENSTSYVYAPGNYTYSATMAGVRFEMDDGFSAYIDGYQVDRVVNEPLFLVYDEGEHRISGYTYRADELSGDYNTQYYAYEYVEAIGGMHVPFENATGVGVYILHVRYIGE